MLEIKHSNMNHSRAGQQCFLSQCNTLSAIRNSHTSHFLRGVAYVALVLLGAALPLLACSCMISANVNLQHSAHKPLCHLCGRYEWHAATALLVSSNSSSCKRACTFARQVTYQRLTADVSMTPPDSFNSLKMCAEHMVTGISCMHLKLEWEQCTACTLQCASCKA